MEDETEEGQMIFRNLETHVDWLSPVGVMWPIIPRIGESILWTDDENESNSFRGVVEDVHWSIGPNPGYSVFICIRPS